MLQIPSHLDPGVEVIAGDTESRFCEFCPEKSVFQSDYHFQKHLQSRGHLKRVLQGLLIKI
jgi:hypothetical protein